MRIVLVLSLLASAACTGGVGADDDDDGADGGAGAASLAITSPADGASFERTVVTDEGALVARVRFEARVDGPVDRVVWIDQDGITLAELSAPGFSTDIDFDLDGEQLVQAFAYDPHGEEVAAAEVWIHVTSPDAADCHDFLTQYGVEFEVGPAQPGVADPVTVTTPIAGIRYRYVDFEEPRADFFMDCEMARSLVLAAPFLHARGVVEVADIGLYNYRCIGDGEPPNCPSGMSEHSWGKAIDLGGFTTTDGTYYSVLDDWVIDPSSQATCEADTESAKDAWLHELICTLKGAGIWNIVLTPNYNSDHRSHFHVDLTDGSDFIRRQGAGVHGLSPGLERAAQAD